MTSLPLARRMAWVAGSVACLVAVLVACSQPQPPTVPLYRALQVGDLDQVKRHVYHGSNINSPDGAGDYPIHVSVRNAQVAIARVLLDHGASLDVRDAKGRTPLHLALAAGRTEVADVLDKVVQISGCGPYEAWMGMRKSVEKPWQYTWTPTFALATPAKAEAPTMRLVFFKKSRRDDV